MPETKESTTTSTRLFGVVTLLTAAIGAIAWVSGEEQTSSRSAPVADAPEPVRSPSNKAADAPIDVPLKPELRQALAPAAPTAFDGRRSYDYLKALCALGNRMSGSLGMKQQQALVEKHFRDLGAQVTFQRFKYKHPLNGKRVPMANLIVEWHPEAKQRLLLCAHYDTRPLPDRDVNPRVRAKGVFLGANDGASGVALLMELGHHVANLPLNYGLDFVLFDGEELVYFDGRDDIGSYFAGSRWFASQYVKQPPPHRYTAGVLFDMVADADLTIYQEENSVTWKETRSLVNEIWATAQRMGIREFIPRQKYKVNDDHLPLYYLAKIPVCDVIDFEFPDARNQYWHTTADSPGRCSGDSLGKVGSVIMEWLATKR